MILWFQRDKENSKKIEILHENLNTKNSKFWTQHAIEIILYNILQLI